ncbi:MAG TPA: hypothetical protein VMV29_20125 [Ktedonobacterales bacterium]|nr:hypothetical protein [Ktedonobacterales bacterium]
MRDPSLERRRRSPQDRPRASGARNASAGRDARDAWEDEPPPTTGASKLTLSSMPRVGATGGLIRSPQEAWETQASLYADEDADRDEDDYDRSDDARSGRSAHDDYDAYDADAHEAYDERDEYNQYGDDGYADDRAPEPGDTSPRLRATSAARPLRTTKGRLMTGAALERLERQEQEEWQAARRRDQRDDCDDDYEDDLPAGRSAPRLRAADWVADDAPLGPGASSAYGRSGSSGAQRVPAGLASGLDESLFGASGKRRALVAVAPARAIASQPLSTESVPDLPAFKSALAPRRPRIDTQRIIQSARSPWSVTRIVLTIIAICVALVFGFSHMGEPSQPLMATGFRSQVGSQANPPLTSLVKPETQGKRPDLYDSYDQFNNWWDAACSAAVLSEILTAYGVPHATIGRMIDELGPDISLYGGLVNEQGFERVAAKYGLRADYLNNLTYHQMLYITNTLGLPLIVNVRIAYGYYHFLSGGHYLVMTGGDPQGLSIVDSSEYYINYLPLDVFNSMFTGRTVVIVPASYQYTLPSN